MEPKLIFLFIMIAVATAAEAVAGFGSTIIALTICALFYPIDFLVPVLVPLNLVLSSYIVLRGWRSIDSRELLGRILPFAGAGLAAGIAVFTLLNGVWLKFVYGAFVLCLSSVELARMRSARYDAPAGDARLPVMKAAPWLLLGGVIQGMYASGGPLIVYYASRAITDKTRFRSTLSTLWLVLNIFLMAGFLIKGKANAATFKVDIILAPALLIGIIAGDILHKKIQERAFRVFVYVLLTVAGFSLTVKTAFDIFSH